MLEIFRSPPFHILKATEVNEPVWTKVENFRFDPFRGPFGAAGCSIDSIGAFVFVTGEPHLSLHLGNSMDITSSQTSEGNVNHIIYTGDGGSVKVFPALTISPAPQSRPAGSGVSPAIDTSVLRCAKTVHFLLFVQDK